MYKKNKYIEEVLNTKILPFVLKPGRYIGNEINAVSKNERDVSIRFALAFPDVYEIAMSYQGFDILYHILNNEEDIWAERVFAPWTDMEKKLREHKVPLYSLESFTPLKDFDIIGFTLQYELTYTNILNMLDLSGIPLWQKERKEDDPIILAGGPCSCNPEPAADFFPDPVLPCNPLLRLDLCGPRDRPVASPLLRGCPDLHADHLVHRVGLSAGHAHGLRSFSED